MTTSARPTAPTRPGEVVLETVVDMGDVVDRARNRYAAGVVADTTGWADGDRRRLEELGFRGGDARGAALRTLDLTIADDGTPTRLLDNPALASLNGEHARFAERRGEIARYLPDVSVWTGIPERPTPEDWEDVRALIGSGAVFGVGASAVVPEGWQTVEGSGGVQLTGEAIEGAPDAEAVELTQDDVPEMTELVARTKPGPFLPRTIELGRYVGVRRDGRLIAMAGERLHPPGWTEISAVCTDEAFRGQGLGRRLVLDVAYGIRQRGEVPLMHAAAGNTGAIGLYQHLGFRLRDRGAPRFVQVP
ncbi:FR47-like protein [Curtobacterium flaccumfaciens]|uniref:FR47-like protein n=1 Tax=Curtobacterium flaccumfaciens TaxID=2035 RepID=A0A4R6DHR2_9MICO|nr:GNAT family N-acetyltransferase [Curtobacterium flaccumfaciens]TDN44296.1 FR47-like protein [Curtobacterium flaccumfaciens]